MSDLVFSPASSAPIERLAEAFNRGFEGYLVPMHHTADSLSIMLRTNDVRLTDSLIAWTPGGESAGVALLAVRGDRGWVAGMGIAPELRGDGHGAALLSALIARVRALGLATLQLEVLDENTPARRLYTRLGFAEVRPLVVYNGPSSTPPATAPPATPRTIRDVPVAQALAHFAKLHQVAPPWQRDYASLVNMAPTLTACALGSKQSIRAYLLFMPTGTGHGILDAGSRAPSAEARAGELQALLAYLLTGAPETPLRVINVPPGDALGDALTVLGCPVVATQREMVLRLG